MLTTLLLLATTTPALAEGPLMVPNWSQPVRYRAEVGISTPDGSYYLGRQNLEARAATHELVVEMSCEGEPSGKGWAVECMLDHVLMGGVAYAADQDDLDAIQDEYVEMLTGATVQLQIAKDGRIAGLDLEGAERVDERMGIILEHQRLLLRRAFAPLDLGLPKKGERTAQWKHKGVPLLFELMTAYGTAGGSKFMHTLEGTEDGITRISSFGRANVATGIDLEVGAGQIVNMVGGGNARWDDDAQQLLWREISVTGELTAESVQLGDTNVYGMIAWVGRIEPDGRVQLDHGPEDIGRTEAAPVPDPVAPVEEAVQEPAQGSALPAPQGQSEADAAQDAAPPAPE